MYNHETELYHYGIKGMKWGVRRAKKAVDKYSQKAQRQIDANMKNAEHLKKLLDTGYDEIDERRLTKSDVKAYTYQYNTAIESGKAWMTTRDDIMKMNVNDITVKDVKQRFKNSGARVYYPFG